MEIMPTGAAPASQSAGASKSKSSSAGNSAQKLQTENARAKEAEDVKLRTACKDFEAVFLNMLWKEMRATVPKDTLMGDNSQEEIMHSMLDNEMTKNMAAAGGIGLADMLYRQLSFTAAAAKGRASK